MNLQRYFACFTLIMLEKVLMMVRTIMKANLVFSGFIKHRIKVANCPSLNLSFPPILLFRFNENCSRNDFSRETRSSQHVLWQSKFSNLEVVQYFSICNRFVEMTEMMEMMEMMEQYEDEEFLWFISLRSSHTSSWQESWSVKQTVWWLLQLLNTRHCS